jgi:hypothetical protein
MKGCENVGVCMWCRREVGANHLCEKMCTASAVVIRLEEKRKEALR